MAPKCSSVASVGRMVTSVALMATALALIVASLAPTVAALALHLHPRVLLRALSNFLFALRPGASAADQLSVYIGAGQTLEGSFSAVSTCAAFCNQILILQQIFEIYKICKPLHRSKVKFFRFSQNFRDFERILQNFAVMF